MITRNLCSVAFLAVFAVLYLPAEKLFAQAPATPLSVVVTSASGAERHLPGYDCMVGRAGLGPEQLVTVTLQFPSNMAGKQVGVSSLDGGEVTRVDGGTSELSVGEDGTTPFQFHAGHMPGLYRLIVQFGADSYALEFYVIDLDHLEKNPPRVQIVN